MSKSNRSIKRFLNPILGCLLLIASGCSTADIITYSRDAQREGERQFRDGNYADAAGAFRNSVRQNPQNYEASYWLGASYEKLGQYQQAIPAYKTARQTIMMSMQGKYDHVFRYKILDGLGNAIARSDERDVETNIVQQDAESHGSADSWYLMAKIYSSRGDADSAIDAFNRATLLEPTNYYVNRAAGLYLEKVGQSDRAATALRKAYASNNQDTEVADALRRIGIVPGPSLNEQRQLAAPLVPKGPIPEIPVNNSGNSNTARQSVSAPRD